MKNPEYAGFEKDIRTHMKEYFKKINGRPFCLTNDAQIDVGNVSKFSKEELKKKLRGIKQNAVYIITSQESFEGKQRKAYNNCKKNGFQMSRDMFKKHHENTNKPCCLYVGSSITDVNTRLKQHLGITESKTTYALHLKYWWKDATLQITVYQFNDDIEDYVLQFIEDCLWEENKPIFGRKGGK
ncbi:hypothetical protein FACS1894141_1020 [Spirochaetia bacterium]|nr:hypothetical protein FACS1894141_1020 [Spirochaetia bacterium]